MKVLLLSLILALVMTDAPRPSREGAAVVSGHEGPPVYAARDTFAALAQMR
ncbi:hypothetical protein Cseg_1726 [Caulobacter segnis ATCC 21756]|uniref:Uncharacterized protein n=1 Tax=Caulobacter segnis (strain ATCC 21756 / DSM 7131 / JCM 7823 / NBRC 15250 / LMG 17158 / TK0059) TaxID=509190 RepID=D5VG87_CAUST|nr:hypothetical protein Cseg_1726 [Caulobacter segnis ATCC 21756]